jgi:hypothetical protein
MTKSYSKYSSFLFPFSSINSVSNERRLISASGCRIFAIFAVVSLISKAVIIDFSAKSFVA